VSESGAPHSFWSAPSRSRCSKADFLGRGTWQGRLAAVQPTPAGLLYDVGEQVSAPKYAASSVRKVGQPTRYRVKDPSMTDAADFPPAVRALIPISVEAMVWAALKADPVQSIRTIGRRIGVPKTYVHLAVRRLIDAGLVRCEIPGDGTRPARYIVSDQPMERIA